jgi:hypothetical protein
LVGAVCGSCGVRQPEFELIDTPRRRRQLIDIDNCPYHIVDGGLGASDSRSQRTANSGPDTCTHSRTYYQAGPTTNGCANAGTDAGARHMRSAFEPVGL